MASLRSVRRSFLRRATRRRYSAEEKIRIVLEGLRGESSIAELCRKEGINQKLHQRFKHATLASNCYNMYYTSFLNREVWDGLIDMRWAGIEKAMIKALDDLAADLRWRHE